MTKTIDALESAYQAGWMAAASWANRLDLLADMGSSAFTKEQAAAVQRIAQARAEQAGPVYQYQKADGSWIDQTKTSHDYNVEHGQATVRVLYTTPPAAPVARAEQAEPVAFVSPLQFEQRLVDPEGEFGTYIPMRKTSAGNFTQPLFATPPAAPVAKLEPLSPEEIAEPFKPFRTTASTAFIEGVRFAEAAHNAKLGGAQ